MIQAQRDVRKSINATSAGKRDPDLSSPGKPDYVGEGTLPTSSSKSRKQSTRISTMNQNKFASTFQDTSADDLAISFGEIVKENENLRSQKVELENSNMILRKYKKIY